MSKAKPNFLIIGAARCGTTALAQYLGQHPDVYFCDPKEPHFLAFAGQNVSFQGPGDDIVINRVVTTDPDAYLELFAPGCHHAAIGEGSVSTLYYHQESIQTIEKYVPNAKFIVMVRNPIARAYSSFLYTSSRGFEPESDFAAALDDEPRRISENWHHLWHYTRMGFYRQPIGHFHRAFGPDRVRVVLFDAFQQDPKRVVQNLFGFLNVDSAFEPDTSLVINRSGTARSWPVRAAMKLAYRRPIIKSALKALLPMRVREKLRNQGLSRLTIPQSAKESLRQLYTDEVHSLGELLKLDLRHWLSDDLNT